MPTRAVKITSKGQATIPKEIRDLLKTDIVEFEVVEGTVVVKPVLGVFKPLFTGVCAFERCKRGGMGGGGA